jgi:membrane protein DedA with SNARE-associated domain
MARMPYGRFLLYTTLGAGVWHVILAAIMQPVSLMVLAKTLS